jgi:hypothetical protein
VALRPTPDPEVVPLLRAIKARIDGLSQVSSTPKDGADVYYRNKTAFLQLEIRRDHMSLDLWLSGAQLEEARASGIARAHPFLGDDAVKVRFERAQDLSRVARWIEASYTYASERGRKTARKSSEKPVVKTTPLLKSIVPPSNSASMSPMPSTEPKNGVSSNGAAPKSARAKKPASSSKKARSRSTSKKAASARAPKSRASKASPKRKSARK